MKLPSLPFWRWSAIRILGIVMIILVSSSTSSAESYERMTFVNFSDEPIQVYWVDRRNNNERSPEQLVAPFDSFTAQTFSGHIFSYEWKGTNLFAHVRETSSMLWTKEDSETENDPDLSTLKAQVHILGGMDQAETKKVVCGTTKGDIRINVKPFWSPRGAARFLQLAHKDLRYFDGCALNRVVPGFLTQFGIGADLEQRSWFRVHEIPDDPHLDPPIPFRHGTMSYAGSGKDSRSNEVFIVMPDAPQRQLDYFGGENTWETPFGYVEPEDLTVVGSWHSYGDMTPWGDGPDPQLMYKEDGYEYLKNDFPKLDYIRGCAIVPEADLNDPDILSLGYDELAKHVFDDEEAEEL